MLKPIVNNYVNGILHVKEKAIAHLTLASMCLGPHYHYLKPTSEKEKKL